MRIERVSGKEERAILTGMLVDSAVAGKVASKWRPELFQSRWANLVGQWCVDYFNRYGKAPRRNVQGLFEAWAAENADKETTGLVEKFLGSLSDEYEALAKESNSQYTIDLAATHFERVAYAKLVSVVQGHLDNGQLKKARKAIVDFSLVDMKGEAPVDVLNDAEEMRQAFEEDQDSLIDYPGAVGEFFKGQLQRACLVAILAPEKRGKSFWLEDLGYRAVKQRRKTVFFSAGDLTKRQMLRRWATRIARRPMKPGTYEIPHRIRKRKGKLPELKCETKKYDQPLSWQKAHAAAQEFQQSLRSKESFLKMVVHPMASLNLQIIDNELDEMERAGFVVDVVVVDYPDIMEMPLGNDLREKTNALWMGLRRLAQKRNCLVVVATQADAASYSQETMTRSNFSEDKRKLAHVTGMFALNQNSKEKKLGVTRLNWIALREAAYMEDQCLYVAGNLAIANPCLCACFAEYEDEEETAK